MSATNTSNILKKTTHYLLLTLLVCVSVGPFVWLLITALKPGDENIFGGSFWPKNPTLENFTTVWQQVNLGGYMLNSLIVTALTILLNLTFSVLAAYPLARMNFKGRQAILMTILATMMIPFQVIMIPLYLIVLKFGLTDQSAALWHINGWDNLPVHVWVGLTLPFAISGFGIFFMRQALINLPKELEEAAVMDGCNSLQVLVKVLLPLILPSLATLAVFTFMSSWGEFLWPSIVLSDEANFTLPVGLVYLQGSFSANWRLIAAGTIISMLPILTFFVLLQRYFVQGAAAGAVKG